MKRINRKEFINTFLNKYNNYKQIFFDIKGTQNSIFFVDEENYKQITIEFISSKNYLFTIYVNCDNKEENNFIIDYFKNIDLDKNYCIHNVLDNEDYII